jgi:hypothetical protein
MSPLDNVAVTALTNDELGAALVAGVVDSDWYERAAVDLIVNHPHWLSRAELRRAIVAGWDEGELYAWVAWHEVPENPPASSGELRILDIARSLGGLDAHRRLDDLLSGLDEASWENLVQGKTFGVERNAVRGNGEEHS